MPLPVRARATERWKNSNAHTSDGEADAARLNRQSSNNGSLGSDETLTNSNPASAKYTFSKLDFNSMILVPPDDAVDSRPAYHISHHLNGFLPSSIITVIRRGGLGVGEIIGEFQMGTPRNPHATVTQGGHEYLLEERFMRARKRDGYTNHVWQWRLDPSKSLWWTDFKHCNPTLCWTEDRGQPLAKLYFPGVQALRRGQRAQETVLEMFPSGYEHFDTIVICVLLMERARLSRPAVSSGYGGGGDFWTSIGQVGGDLGGGDSGGGDGGGGDGGGGD